jgi:uncharacterized protein (TIGR02271 family)
MKDSWSPIRDVDGKQGSFRMLGSDAARMEVELDDGARMIVPASHVRGGPSGPYRFESSFSALLQGAQRGELVVPVLEEEVEVHRRKVARERVRVTTQVSEREQVVDLKTVHEDISVERVPIGRVVDAAEAPRQEGDTLVVPVYDEVLVVEKRLVLREELRLVRTRSEHVDQQRVTLRREDVQVERTRLPGSAEEQS